MGFHPFLRYRFTDLRFHLPLVLAWQLPLPSCLRDASDVMFLVPTQVVLALVRPSPEATTSPPCVPCVLCSLFRAAAVTVSDTVSPLFRGSLEHRKMVLLHLHWCRVPRSSIHWVFWSLVDAAKTIRVSLAPSYPLPPDVLLLFPAFVLVTSLICALKCGIVFSESGRRFTHEATSTTCCFHCVRCFWDPLSDIVVMQHSVLIVRSLMPLPYSLEFLLLLLWPCPHLLHLLHSQPAHSGATLAELVLSECLLSYPRQRCHRLRLMYEEAATPPEVGTTLLSRRNTHAATPARIGCDFVLAQAADPTANDLVQNGYGSTFSSVLPCVRVSRASISTIFHAKVMSSPPFFFKKKLNSTLSQFGCRSTLLEQKKRHHANASCASAAGADPEKSWDSPWASP